MKPGLLEHGIRVALRGIVHIRVVQEVLNAEENLGCVYIQSHGRDAG